MKERVFVITASSGQWSDVAHWVARVYRNLEDAQRYVDVEMLEIQRRRNTELTEAEETEFQYLLNTDDPDYDQDRYNELSKKRNDYEAHDFNGYHIKEYTVQ